MEGLPRQRKNLDLGARLRSHRGSLAREGIVKTFVKTFLRTVQILLSLLMAWMGFAWGRPHESKPKPQPQLQRQLQQQPEPDTPEYVPPSKRSSPGYGKDHEARPRLLLVIE